MCSKENWLLLSSITNIIEWCNTNEGFLLTVLTLLYVVATILILISNKRTLDIAKKQIDFQYNTIKNDNIKLKLLVAAIVLKKKTAKRTAKEYQHYLQSTGIDITVEQTLDLCLELNDSGKMLAFTKDRGDNPLDWEFGKRKTSNVDGA